MSDLKTRSEPIAYMTRTREYYLALGYENPYRWAHFEEVPFVSLDKPMAESRIALITTSAPFKSDAGDQGPGAAYNGRAKFFEVLSYDRHSAPDLRISHVGYDRDHTSARDPNTWFPLARLEEAVARGRIGSVADRIHCAPTTRSQRTTRDTDAPEVLRRCREDDADAALLVPN